MRVGYARPPKGGHSLVVDSRGRARLARAAIVSPKAMGFAAACALLAIAPETGPGARLLASGQSAVKSAADYIRARSPGVRQRADLVKVKHPRAAVRPVARAAPRYRRPAPRALLAPPPPAVPLTFDTAALAPVYQPVFAGPPLLFAETPGGVPCCFETFNPPLTTVGGGFTIGGGGGGPGGTVPTPPAVPEPSTWMLMILGFGAIGVAWRRRRALLRAVQALPRLVHRRMLLLTDARD
ncbi:MULTISPECIES: PEPxxWA-CTERM sorting domain-containing protein [Sphingomonas]|nr:MULTISPECIES: PEPxxWA-CTERM sorting domain-containing protein [Sphingomonas]